MAIQNILKAFTLDGFDSQGQVHKEIDEIRFFNSKKIDILQNLEGNQNMNKFDLDVWFFLDLWLAYNSWTRNE